jgi:glycosyltransferase involved in cell wall biosynthesis
VNILISISNLALGGAQTFVSRLASELSKNHVVYVYNLFDDGSANKIKSRFSPNIKIISFSIPLLCQRFLGKLDSLFLKLGLKVTSSEFIKLLHFRLILAYLKIDVVNSHLYHSDNFVVNALQKYSTPIIITDHGDYRYVIKEKIGTSASILKIFSRVDAVIYVSESNAASITKYTANSQAIMRKIYYGVSRPTQKSHFFSGRRKLEISEEARVFGMVARGIPEKGWAEAVQAFEIVQSLTERRIHLIVVGDSDYLDTLKKSVDEKLSSCVHFVGYSSEPEYWIESFDVGLLPTSFPGESLPNSVIEYLSLGKPVIATEVGGIPEMVNYEGQLAGFLIKLNQDGRADVPSMTDAMLKYISDPNLLEQHSCLAKQAFDKFRIETCTESYESLFREVISTAS